MREHAQVARALSEALKFGNFGSKLCVELLGTMREASMHFLIFAFALYFAPAIIAGVRHTHNSTGILLLNLFLGWTVVGWFVASADGDLLGPLLRPTTIVADGEEQTAARLSRTGVFATGWLLPDSFWLRPAWFCGRTRTSRCLWDLSYVLDTAAAHRARAGALSRLSAGARAAHVSYSGGDHSPHRARVSFTTCFTPR